MKNNDNDERSSVLHVWLMRWLNGFLMVNLFFFSVGVAQLVKLVGFVEGLGITLVVVLLEVFVGWLLERFNVFCLRDVDLEEGGGDVRVLRLLRGDGRGVWE